jgi:hypothetical protein
MRLKLQAFAGGAVRIVFLFGGGMLWKKSNREAERIGRGTGLGGQQRRSLELRPCILSP